MPTTQLPPLDTDMLACLTYDPDRLLNAIMAKLKIKNDAGLAAALGLNAPTISKIRARRGPISNSVILRIHDVTQLPVDKIRELMGLPAFYQQPRQNETAKIYSVSN